MATRTSSEPATLPDFNVSWSNRNGGELLLTVGSFRTVMSAAWGREIVNKFSRALDVPMMAAAMSSREFERVADPEPTITESLASRRSALESTVPHAETRLSAVREARALIANEGAVAVHIAGLLFTASELEAIEDKLRCRPAAKAGRTASGVA